MRKIHLPLVLLLLFSLLSFEVQAVDFTNGETTALPVKDGKAPKIDGDFSDWDLSAAEPVYISVQSAETMHAEWAVMYDDSALYLSAQVSMPGRPYMNVSNPQDAFWSQDILQVRMSSDPALPYPLDGNRDAESDRVQHISFWKNSESGEDFIQITVGTKLNKAKMLNPKDSAIKIITDTDKGYVMEAKIPWSALNVPSGKNPFKPGESGAFIAETLWIGGDTSRVPLGYHTNPGTFAFNKANSWGKLNFAEKSPGKRIRPSMADVIAQAKAEAMVQAPQIGVPFDITVPEEGLKVSVNIVGKDGQVIREVLGGESHPKGKMTVHWDGRDAFGNVLKPGSYTWGAYFHKPIQAEYQGGVGSSGHPYYKTQDNKGGWGGDHSYPIDAASDADSLFMLWPVSEAGQALIKTDFEGKVKWRKNPFVGGGFGPFFSVAVDEKYVYLARGNENIYLVKLDIKTGALQTWGQDGPGETLIYTTEAPVPVAFDATPASIGGKKWDLLPKPEGYVVSPDPMGLAVREGKVYMGSFSQNKIYIIDAPSGKVLGDLSCPGVRGITFGPGGDLFAVSYLPGKGGSILRFTKAQGAGAAVVTSGLEAPYDVTVMKDGSLVVTDLGKSQQVKMFEANGKAGKIIGQAGGRPWQGKYDPAGLTFLHPAGLTADAEGNIVVAEASPPKVFSRIQMPGGKLVNRWYGAGVYWNATWPMPDNPRNVFYEINEAIGRADLAGVDKVGVPNAYWAPEHAGYPQVGDIEGGIPQPEIVKASNGELYLVRDVREHAVYLLKNDVLRPVATWQGVSSYEKENQLKKPYINAWIDRNGDGLVQDAEKERLLEIADKTAMPNLSNTTSSLHMRPNGDLYFTTQDNCILKIPAKGFGSNGLIEWETRKASLAVPQVMPGLDKMSTTYRQGLLGVRLDEKGNIYTLFNTKLKGGTGEYDYPNEETAKQMLEGMGHTSSFNAVKMAKFDPAGKLIWLAGRKATAGAAAGEMYHFWNMAGLVNDKYIVGGSEWGQIYFYTHDGFFVDALMNNPGDVTLPGPYTFGGETSGGRVAYFADTGELWAYSSGMAYKVNGFSKGAVENESRASGSVTLDKVYELASVATGPSGPLQIVSLTGDPIKEATAWKNVPASSLTKGGKELASAQLGYDKKFLYARIVVKDESPLENNATEDQLVFKQGDTAGVVLGPDRKSDKPGEGDIRLMAVKTGGKAKLIAMKAVSKQDKRPFVYETPAAGKWSFDFVAEVPGSVVDLQESRDGYVATFAVPLGFLEFPLTPGSALKGDVEVRLSGNGQRGLQAVSRNYLFTPNTSATTMVDDIPTEARLYPEFWGAVEVK